jgi:ABC-type lipoprotein export system ATPase subunit
MNNEIIKINNLNKDYYQNVNKISVLKNLNFNVLKSEIVAILGPSGSGKSTFLNILGLLDSDFTGEYFLMQKNSKSFSNKEKNLIRNRSIGFVHQFFHLIPELSVLENVCLPSLIKGVSYKESQQISIDILVNFGLKDRINSKPLNLSGGEKQRVSIARALINNPDVIFADEMTGNLDQKTSDLVFKFFLEKIKSNFKTLIYVTHNKEYAKKADKIYEIINHELTRIL